MIKCFGKIIPANLHQPGNWVTSSMLILTTIRKTYIYLIGVKTGSTLNCRNPNQFTRATMHNTKSNEYKSHPPEEMCWVRS